MKATVKEAKQVLEGGTPENLISNKEIIFK
jgi:hypothetical protein